MQGCASQAHTLTLIPEGGSLGIKAFVVHARPCQSAAGKSGSKDVPPGAVALGYTKCVIRERPAAADVAPGKNGNFKWFSGQWYSKTNPPLSHYSTRNGELVMTLGGNLVSAPLDFSAGKLPLLAGADGFYVEFDVRLSDNDKDHWPAVWLMPAEHDGKHDQYEGDPKGFERFMELDVDEGGFGPRPDRHGPQFGRHLAQVRARSESEQRFLRSRWIAARCTLSAPATIRCSRRSPGGSTASGR